MIKKTIILILLSTLFISCNEGTRYDEPDCNEGTISNDSDSYFNSHTTIKLCTDSIKKTINKEYLDNGDIKAVLTTDCYFKIANYRRPSYFGYDIY